MRPRPLIATAALVLALTSALVAQRPDAFAGNFDQPAIAYSKGPVTDAVAALNTRLANGSVRLAVEPTSGYLRAVLGALEIPVESQALVFSQTSQQADQIHFQSPRAVFFNDHAAVGWVRGADRLEIAAQDPRQGVIFYTLDQAATSSPRFVRQTGCLLCHLSWDNLGVPGLMMLSTDPLPDKNAYATGGTTDQRSPFAERWGGWFVTGRHGVTRHKGNVPVMPEDKGKSKLANPRAPIDSVQGLFDLTGYPTPYSDVVSLLILAHQTHMTNLITRIGWEARVAAESKDPARVRDAAKDVVDYMLFVDEAPLLGKVEGTSGFAKVFAAAGPRDSKGRSLRDFDLVRRMFRYPCSYMVYSAAFEALPPVAKDAVYARMWEVLSGKAVGRAYRKLTAADRQAIIDILRETKKDLPAYFGRA